MQDLKRLGRFFLSAVILGIGILQGVSGGSTKALADLPKGLVLYWSFDAGEGDIVVDQSNNGNNGLLKSGARWVEGRFGSAMELDGLGALIEASLTESLPPQATGFQFNPSG